MSVRAFLLLRRRPSLFGHSIRRTYYAVCPPSAWHPRAFASTSPCHFAHQSAQDSVLGNIRQPEKFKAAVAEMVADMQKIPAQLVSNAIKNLGTNVGASPEA